MASLGHDLKTLRKKQSMDLDDVHKITKIPIPILSSIEDHSIFEEIDANTTYTRSYVRNYARAIGIEEQAILHALDQVQRGEYEGGLFNKPDKEESTKKPKEESKPSKDKTKDATPEKNNPQPQKIYPHSSRKEASTKWNWANVNHQTHSAGSKAKGRNQILLFFILVLVCVGGFLVYYYYFKKPASEKSRSAPINQTKKPPVPSDSLREALAKADENKPPANAKQITSKSLPDTLRLSINAANGNLEPVRVKTDLREIRNPYWVSQGDTVSFNFVNSMQVRAVNQYPRLQLIFNGHAIENAFQQYYDQDAEAIKITRKLIEKHKDWW